MSLPELEQLNQSCNDRIEKYQKKIIELNGDESYGRECINITRRELAQKEYTAMIAAISDLQNEVKRLK